MSNVIDQYTHTHTVDAEWCWRKWINSSLKICLLHCIARCSNNDNSKQQPKPIQVYKTSHLPCWHLMTWLFSDLDIKDIVISTTAHVTLNVCVSLTSSSLLFHRARLDSLWPSLGSFVYAYCRLLILITHRVVGLNYHASRQAGPQFCCEWKSALIGVNTRLQNGLNSLLCSWWCLRSWISIYFYTIVSY